jgi:hypothetical protein
MFESTDQRCRFHHATGAVLNNSSALPYRLDIDGTLPFVAFVAARLLILGLSKAELARRMGYQANISKGIRRLEVLLAGDLKLYINLRPALVAALQAPEVELDEVVADTRYVLWARNDRAYRAEFRPHVVWATTQSIPSPITIAALIDAHGRLFWYPRSSEPSEISDEAALALTEGVPCYGRVIGFHVNYTPDNAVSFDCAGTPMTVLDAAVRPGRARASIGGRQFAFSTTSRSSGISSP